MLMFTPTQYWVFVQNLDPVPGSGSCTRFWILNQVLGPVPGPGSCTGFLILYQVLDSVPGPGSCTGFWILYQVLDSVPYRAEIECCPLHCDLFADTRNQQVQSSPLYGPLRMEIESGIRANHIATNAASYSTRCSTCSIAHAHAHTR